jgi:hypothetical protein
MRQVDSLCGDGAVPRYFLSPRLPASLPNAGEMQEDGGCEITVNLPIRESPLGLKWRPSIDDAIAKPQADSAAKSPRFGSGRNWPEANDTEATQYL